jgi:hypothetical protein
MRRAVVAMALVVSACVAEPPERASLPDVAEVLPKAQGCVLSIGDPRGVVIDTVVTGSAADGLLRTGDIILSIDDVETLTAGELTSLMADRSPGDEIEVAYERAGARSETPLVLGAHPDDDSRPQIGILIRTSYDTIPVADADQTVTPSFTARLVVLGETLVAVDPTTGAWSVIEQDLALGSSWVATTRGIYSLVDEPGSPITDALTEEPVPVDDFQDWEPRRLIGSLGERLLVVVTTDIPEQPGFVNVGIALFDPVTGETLWVTPVLTGFGVPVTAFGAPDRSGFVVVGADSETGAVTGVEFFDAFGSRRDVGTLTDLGTPIGWFDGTSMAFRPNPEQLAVYDFADGSIRNFTVPGGMLDSLIAAVGDGSQILAIDGRNLLISDLTSASSEIRTLAENCSISRIGEPGWGL